VEDGVDDVREKGERDRMSGKREKETGGKLGGVSVSVFECVERREMQQGKQ